MNAVHNFPGVKPWLDAIARKAEKPELDARRDKAVDAAMAVIRSHAPHKVDDIKRACAVLLSLGGRAQQYEAEMMLQALALRPERKPRRVIVRPAYSDGLRMARDVLLGSLVTVWLVWAALVLVMA